ncbi:MAG: alpha-ketoglutarate-dependent dioxygenase AlkB [Candidatus Rokuibacteriota bacterium]|nr:MAG: alpha-ketoglutarate-dependent dioxygenase AlkB [Candidatus Rokubacteria bacterium]
MDREPPSGFLYYPDVLSAPEEAELSGHVRDITFSAVEMRGQVARRRTAHFGWVYGYESWRITPGPPLPDFLHPLRERVAVLASVEPAALAEVLVTEYPAGATIGWHRDAPQFGVVIGVSLLSACRMRFQRGRGAERQTRAVTLEPCSAYVLTGEARQHWQHSIPAVRAPRYSVTFRTLRTRERGASDGETALRRA